MMRHLLGYTLVELMVSVALISVLATIAISAYTGYVREGHYATMKTTINQFRTPIEDARLENGGYGTAGNLSGFAAINARFPLDPDTDFGQYSYTVVVLGTTNYHVFSSYNSDIWIRCEDRANRCCQSNPSNDPAAACPP
jgi:prepilin-type N-terminal cleavage/methylation domain-containing protein